MFGGIIAAAQLLVNSPPPSHRLPHGTSILGTWSTKQKQGMTDWFHGWRFQKKNNIYIFIDITIIIYLDLPRGAELMDDVWGAENHHPLGFKQHPLEDPGMYIYIYEATAVLHCCVNLNVYRNLVTMGYVREKRRKSGCWKRKTCNPCKAEIYQVRQCFSFLDSRIVIPQGHNISNWFHWPISPTYTPPETNMERKHWCFVDVSPFPRGFLQVPCLSSRV